MRYIDHFNLQRALTMANLSRDPAPLYAQVQHLLTKYQAEFTITTVSAAEVASLASRPPTEEELHEIATRLAEDYCEQLFWSSLENIARLVINEVELFAEDEADFFEAGPESGDEA